MPRPEHDPRQNAVDVTGVDLVTEVVRTERLVLRPFALDDVDAVLEAMQDRESRRWMIAPPDPYTREDAVRFVTEVAAGGRAAGTDLNSALEADGALVGACGLHGLAGGRLGPEIGFWVAPWARGRGYAGEAAAGVAAWAFAHGAPRVHLFTDVQNGASQAAVRKGGFEQEGVVRRCLGYRDGRTADALLFGKLAS